MSDRYDSPGKTYNRERWSQLCSGLATQVGRPLDGFWLSNDTFSDLDPIIHLFQQVIVPENVDECYRAKKQYLAENPQLAVRIHLPTVRANVLAMVRTFVKTGASFDVMNLDYCTHFCADVERTISLIFQAHVLRPGGYLFLTVAARSKRNQNGTPHERSLAQRIERVDEQVMVEAHSAKWEAEVLPGYPKLYEGRGLDGTPCLMNSLGWKFIPTPQKERTMPKLTTREKIILVSLRKAGVAPNILADAFGVTTGTVAALLAHANRPANQPAYAARNESGNAQ